jgi:hypothetical protein
MAGAIKAGRIAPEHLRFMLLAYGLGHAYRVVSIDEIAQEISHVKKEEIRSGLDRLAEEGLVTRFSGRFCFNRAIPEEVRRIIEQSVTISGTLKARL